MGAVADKYTRIGSYHQTKSESIRSTSSHPVLSISTHPQPCAGLLKILNPRPLLYDKTRLHLGDIGRPLAAECAGSGRAAGASRDARERIGDVF